MEELRRIRAQIKACRGWEEPLPQSLIKEYRRVRRKYELPRTRRREIARLLKCWQKARESVAKDRFLPYLCTVYELANNWQKQGHTEKWISLARQKYRTGPGANDPAVFLLTLPAPARRLDRRLRHRWLCVLRYCRAFEIPVKRMRKAVLSAGGINACARRWHQMRKLRPVQK